MDQPSQYYTHHSFTTLSVVLGTFAIIFNRIELLPSVWAMGKKYADRYEAMLNKGEYLHTDYIIKPNVEILQADILDFDFSDADIIYIPSTAFEATMMHKLSKKCQKLKPGTRIITLTKPMPCVTEKDCNVSFKVYEKREWLMTWGLGPTNYQIKE